MRLHHKIFFWYCLRLPDLLVAAVFHVRSTDVAVFHVPGVPYTGHIVQVAKRPQDYQIVSAARRLVVAPFASDAASTAVEADAGGLQSGRLYHLDVVDDGLQHSNYAGAATSSRGQLPPVTVASAGDVLAGAYYLRFFGGGFRNYGIHHVGGRQPDRSEKLLDKRRGGPPMIAAASEQSLFSLPPPADDSTYLRFLCRTGTAAASRSSLDAMKKDKDVIRVQVRDVWEVHFGDANPSSKLLVTQIPEAAVASVDEFYTAPGFAPLRLSVNLGLGARTHSFFPGSAGAQTQTAQQSKVAVGLLGFASDSNHLPSWWTRIFPNTTARGSPSSPTSIVPSTPATVSAGAAGLPSGTQRRGNLFWKAAENNGIKVTVASKEHEAADVQERLKTTPFFGKGPIDLSRSGALRGSRNHLHSTSAVGRVETAGRSTSRSRSRTVAIIERGRAARAPPREGGAEKEQTKYDSGISVTFGESSVIFPSKEAEAVAASPSPSKVVLQHQENAESAKVRGENFDFHRGEKQEDQEAGRTSTTTTTASNVKEKTPRASASVSGAPAGLERSLRSDVQVQHDMDFKFLVNLLGLGYPGDLLFAAFFQHAPGMVLFIEEEKASRAAKFLRDLDFELLRKAVFLHNHEEKLPRQEREEQGPLQRPAAHHRWDKHVDHFDVHVVAIRNPELRDLFVVKSPQEHEIEKGRTAAIGSAATAAQGGINLDDYDFLFRSVRLYDFEHDGDNLHLESGADVVEAQEETPGSDHLPALLGSKFFVPGYLYSGLHVGQARDSEVFMQRDDTSAPCPSSVTMLDGTPCWNGGSSLARRRWSTRGPLKEEDAPEIELGRVVQAKKTYPNIYLAGRAQGLLIRGESGKEPHVHEEEAWEAAPRSRL